MQLGTTHSTRKAFVHLTITRNIVCVCVRFALFLDITLRSHNFIPTFRDILSREWYFVTKRRYGIATLRCTIFQWSAYLNYIATEAEDTHICIRSCTYTFSELESYTNFKGKFKGLETDLDTICILDSVLLKFTLWTEISKDRLKMTHLRLNTCLWRCYGSETTYYSSRHLLQACSSNCYLCSMVA
jgi:hypothetical protein